MVIGLASVHGEHCLPTPTRYFLQWACKGLVSLDKHPPLVPVGPLPVLWAHAGITRRWPDSQTQPGNAPC